MDDLLTRLVTLPAEGVAAGAVRVRTLPADEDVPAAARERIDEKWNASLAAAESQNKTLFNAPILALRGAAFTGETLELTLVATDYRTFLVTALRDRAWFAANAPGAIREALGNSALLTHGDRALLGVRSQNVAAYPSRAHLLGGVLEPSEGAASVETLLAHLRKELAEEAGVESGDLAAEPRLRALVRDRFLGQPELIWTWETRGPLEAIAARLHPHEHAGARVLARAVLPEEGEHPLTPVAHEAWRLWSGGEVPMV